MPSPSFSVVAGDSHLIRCFHGLLLDVAGVAIADALGGAIPVVSLLGPRIHRRGPVVAKRIEVVGPCLGREALVLEVGDVDSLAVLGAAVSVVSSAFTVSSSGQSQ